MCDENIANSKEHKYKSSDLKFFKKNIDDSIIVKEGNYKYIAGVDSNLLKYEFVLCEKCNNIKSKKIDNDYDIFSNKYIKHLNLKVETISFENQKLNIYRFLAKNFCCRLASNKIEISKDLIDFVNLKITIPSRLIIQIYSNKDKIEKISKHIGSDYADFGQGKLQFYGNTKNEIELYYSTLIFNNLIFEFYYLNQDFKLENIYSLDCVEVKQFNTNTDFSGKINDIMNTFGIKSPNH